MNFVKQRLIRATLAVALVSTLSGVAFAQELKVGVVNIPVLMERAPQAKVAMDALQEEFAPRQRTIVAKQTEFEELTERVRRDFDVMGETERRNAEKNFATCNARLRDCRLNSERT